jgi:hypothetical protein
MNLTIMPFAGLMPRISPKLLNNQNAQTATNCNFDSGQLSSSKAPLAAGIALQYGVQTIYWFNKNAGGGPYWLQFS